MNPFSLAGRVAMVTGGSRGIGLSAARALAESGARVILVARDSTSLDGAARELREFKADAVVSALDLSDTAQIAKWVYECTARLGMPDILVNAAGITRRGAAIDLTLDDWTSTLAVNATAVFELSRCFARSLIASGKRGKVINIASLMTAAARKGTAAYTASKRCAGSIDQSAGN